MGSPKSIGSVATGSIPDSTLFVKKMCRKKLFKKQPKCTVKNNFFKDNECAKVSEISNNKVSNFN